MDDKTFYDNLDKVINELMQGIKYIVCDIGLLNDTLIELRKRRKQNENN